MNILGVLRQTYLYTALTIAAGATVVALVALLALGLQLAGLTSAAPPPQQIRETVSGSAATLLFALPIGAIHLWLVMRSLRDASERASEARHVYLNGWIVAGLVMTLVSITGLADAVIVQQTLQPVAFQIATIVLGLAVTLVGWRWRDVYGPARRDAQVIAAFATLLVGTVALAIAIFTLVAAMLDTAMGVSYYGSLYRPTVQIWSSLIGIVAGLGMWSIGLRWQWPWREERFRPIYAASGYGLGLVLVALPGSDLLARLIGVFARGVDMSQLRGSLEAPVVGIALVAMHLPWLLRDRGRVAYPPLVTDRIIRGITALCGLAALALAATACGSVIFQDWLRIGPAQDDPLRIREQAIATLIIAVALYPLPWWSFLRATAGDPRSSLRRAFILFVACASLLGAIVAGVVAVTNLIQMALGATLGDLAIRDTVDAAGWLAIFAVILAAHVWILLRDMRAARALGPIATVRSVVVDPLEAILDGVAAGRIGTREAAIKIRALTVPPGVRGRTA